MLQGSEVDDCQPSSMDHLTAQPNNIDTFLENKITIQHSLLVLRLHLGQCVLPLLLSTQTISLCTVKAHSNVIGQYYTDYRQKPERFRYRFYLLLTDSASFFLL